LLPHKTEHRCSILPPRLQWHWQLRTEKWAAQNRDGADLKKALELVELIEFDFAILIVPRIRCIGGGKKKKQDDQCAFGRPVIVLLCLLQTEF